MKIKYKKIAIFDLDGTLYKDNSHIDILNCYYKTNFFNSFLFKILGKLFPKVQLLIMNRLYEKIPMNVKKSHVCAFSTKVVGILKKKVKEGFYPIILSSAPLELIETAASKLKVDFYKCTSGEKHIVLGEKYIYDYLFVCTDNKTDINLLKIADEAVITAKKENHGYFKKKLLGGKYIFIDI